MDESVDGITFDEKGQCDCCQTALARRDTEWFPGAEGGRRLAALGTELRSAGVGAQYDALIGLSGGIDSAYLAHIAVREMGLRVLAVHVDGGWNSAAAVSNIETMVRSLGIDLYTHVVEWREMRDLQVAFLKASVLNQDIPQDHAFFTTLYRSAGKFNLRNFLSGVNFSTESVVPSGFGFPYTDDVHIRAVHRRFSNRDLTSYPLMRLPEFLWLTRIKKHVNVHRPLNFLAYDKNRALDLLKSEYGWKDYGPKHSESRFTKFYQDILLPRKFGFDKRRLHLSSLIVSGQLSRQEALAELQVPLLTLDEERRDIRFVAKKLGLSASELNDLIESDPVDHRIYPNQLAILSWLKRIDALMRLARRGYSRRSGSA